MPRAAASNATHRTVILLRTTDKQRVQKLAREQDVSSSEIVRRCIQAYESTSRKEQEELQAVVAEMNKALDLALESVRHARVEVAANLSQMRKRRAEQA